MAALKTTLFIAIFAIAILPTFSDSVAIDKSSMRTRFPLAHKKLIKFVKQTPKLSAGSASASALFELFEAVDLNNSVVTGNTAPIVLETNKTAIQVLQKILQAIEKPKIHNASAMAINKDRRTVVPANISTHMTTNVDKNATEVLDVDDDEPKESEERDIVYYYDEPYACVYPYVYPCVYPYPYVDIDGGASVLRVNLVIALVAALMVFGFCNRI